jgi:endonuclease/exonuclease/phosphatase family metal-dependent hydrolase
LRKIVTQFIVALFVASCGAPYGAPYTYFYDNLFAPVESGRYFEASAIAAVPDLANELKVMTWNVKFGGARIDFFFDCHGDRVLMNSGEMETNLAGLAEKIKLTDPDILFMQEVDVKSDRVAGYDMVQWLLDNTDLNYGVYASHWRGSVPSNGIGFVNSGNVILSRWKLTGGLRYALDLRSDQNEVVRQFYLKRNILKADVDVPGLGSVVLFNLHAAAFSKDGTKRKHIDTLKKKIDAENSAGALSIAGGDFNTIPPGSDKTDKFDDSVCTGEFEADDYTEEGGWLTTFYNDYNPAIPLADYHADNSKYFSHTTDSDLFWNRKLDYLFTNMTLISGSGKVHQDTSSGMATMPLSDHAPVSFIVDISGSVK